MSGTFATIGSWHNVFLVSWVGPGLTAPDERAHESGRECGAPGVSGHLIGYARVSTRAPSAWITCAQGTRSWVLARYHVECVVSLPALRCPGLSIGTPS